MSNKAFAEAVQTEQMAGIQDQVIDLQTQLAFQEDTINTLNAVVTRQQQQIDRMEIQLENLKKRFELLPDTQGEEVADQKPPHY
ncbi:SlyX family protein [Aestuariirhabdus sp. Z084]|uniref:SlyX family protein n=1 Tax=Aestuariirhabdus haliotis TaxID=2918751 RepID=UPI00201B4327|nr:SlyX family protein [Aestuariirhabdus haliotis]MCL6416311.1 SlyX family protein [Aestuariirhabdus haliotis]MCL6420184.1 SlyX family protein [Aestuariirhabdus haliotis]